MGLVFCVFPWSLCEKKSECFSCMLSEASDVLSLHKAEGHMVVSTAGLGDQVVTDSPLCMVAGSSVSAEETAPALVAIQNERSQAGEVQRNNDEFVHARSGSGRRDGAQLDVAGRGMRTASDGSTRSLLAASGDGIHKLDFESPSGEAVAEMGGSSMAFQIGVSAVRGRDAASG
jgi:hypothetical protein